MYTSFYSGFLAPDATSFILLLATLPTLTLLISLHFVNHVPYVQKCEASTATGMPRGHGLCMQRMHFSGGAQISSV